MSETVTIGDGKRKITVPWAVMVAAVTFAAGGGTGTWVGAQEVRALEEEVDTLQTDVEVIKRDVGYIKENQRKLGEQAEDGREKAEARDEKIHDIDKKLDVLIERSHRR